MYMYTRVHKVYIHEYKCLYYKHYIPCIVYDNLVCSGS